MRMMMMMMMMVEKITKYTLVFKIKIHVVEQAYTRI